MIAERALAVAAVATAACAAERSLPDAPVPIVYPAPLAAWPAAPWTGAIGRGPAPLPLVAAPISAGLPLAPLRAESLWAVPGTGPARAVVSGRIGDAMAVDDIDVDAGVVRWRSDACPGPVVSVTADAVVCAGAERVVGLGAGGAIAWEQGARFVAASGDLVLAANGDSAMVLDAGAGTEAARFAMPEGIAPAALIAACRRDGAVDVWTWQRGALSRLDVRGATAVRAWSATIAGPPASLAGTAGSPVVEHGERVAPPAMVPRVDPCDDTVVVALPADGGEDLVAVARRDGRALGGPVRARGAWTARGGEGLGLELATDAGLERRGRDLGTTTWLGGERLGRLVAARGVRRLVEAEGGLVLLGDEAPRLLAGPGRGALVVLGERHAVALTLGRAVQRWRLPDDESGLPPRAAAPDERALAHYSDLPAAGGSAADGGHAGHGTGRATDAAGAPRAPIALPGAGQSGVAAVAVDPSDAALVYAAPLERPGGGAGLAQLDVRARRWRWHVADACGGSEVRGIAVADDVVVCAASGGARAVARADGTVRWSWSGDAAAVQAAAGAVAIASAEQIVILDATSGREIERVADDRGGAPRFAVGEVGGEALLVAAERGGVVARAPGLGMLPRWGLRVAGAVTDVRVAGDRVAIALASGELYLADIATGGAVVAAGDLGAGWSAPGGGDLVIRAQSDHEWRVAAFGLDGVARFRTGVAAAGPWRLADARGRDPRAPLVLSAGTAALVIDPGSGAVTRLVEIGAAGLVFGTAVDGAAVAGAVLAQPLAIALF